jgi:hypothetical protein
MHWSIARATIGLEAEIFHGGRRKKDGCMEIDSQEKDEDCGGFCGDTPSVKRDLVCSNHNFHRIVRFCTRLKDGGVEQLWAMLN